MENDLVKKNFRQKMLDVPLALSGLGLGVAGLGNAWSGQLQTPQYYHNTNYNFAILDGFSIGIQTFSIFITLICFVIILIRCLMHFEVFKQEIKEPMLNSFFPTLWMSLASIANYIGFVSTLGMDRSQTILNAGTIIANIIMLIAILLQTLFLLLFFSFVIKKHDVKNHVAYASWFVPTVGIAISSLFVNDLGHLIPVEFFQIFWYIGFILYILFFPLITYKIIFFNHPSTERIPSLAIYLSAPNLLLVGATGMFTTKLTPYYPMQFVYVMELFLFFFSIFSILFFAITLFKILNIKFIPIFASLTFPTAVAASSNIKFAQVIDSAMKEYANGNTFLLVFKDIVAFFGFVYLIIATAIILYVLIRFLMHMQKVFYCKTQNSNCNKNIN